jgi:hypothetical protein
VSNGLKIIVSLTKAEREKFRQTMDETYRLIDTTQNLVVIWPGDMLLQDADEDFLREAAQLGNYSEWRQPECGAAQYRDESRPRQMNGRSLLPMCILSDKFEWPVTYENASQCNLLERILVSLLREPGSWRGKIGSTEMSRTITSEKE